MLVVRIELHSAITREVTEIARLHICNDARGSKHRGNYNITSFRGRTTADLDQRIIQRVGFVTNWPRLTRPVWELLAECLWAMGYRNPRGPVGGGGSDDEG